LRREDETAAKDFSDPDEVKSVYYPEVERLLKRVTGADRVLISITSRAIRSLPSGRLFR
jgi:hypothetical protein